MVKIKVTGYQEVLLAAIANELSKMLIRFSETMSSMFGAGMTTTKSRSPYHRHRAWARLGNVFSQDIKSCQMIGTATVRHTKYTIPSALHCLHSNEMSYQQSPYCRIVEILPLEFSVTILDLVKTEIVPFYLLLQNLPENKTWSGSDDPLQRYSNLNFPGWRPSRYLGFGQSRNSAIWSADPEYSTLKPNSKWIRWSVA